MDKEELGKESEKHCNETLCSVCENPTCTEQLRCREWRDRRAGYYCGAEPREKQIQIDAEQIIALQKQNGELTDKVRKLEQQIEKMKRCSICKYSSNLGYCKIRCNGGECNKMDKWELAND